MKGEAHALTSHFPAHHNKPKPTRTSPGSGEKSSRNRADTKSVYSRAGAERRAKNKKEKKMEAKQRAARQQGGNKKSYRWDDGMTAYSA